MSPPEKKRTPFVESKNEVGTARITRMKKRLVRRGSRNINASPILFLCGKAINVVYSSFNKGRPQHKSKARKRNIQRNDCRDFD